MSIPRSTRPAPTFRDSYTIDPATYLTRDSTQRSIVIVDLVSTAFTPNAVLEVVAAPNAKRMPITRIHIPEQRWRKHQNTLPPCGTAEFPWRNSLYTTSVLRNWLPHFPELQTNTPSVIFGKFCADHGVPEFHYHHDPRKTTHALIKIPWRLRSAAPALLDEPDQAGYITPDLSQSAPVPATEIADFDSLAVLEKYHANLWCRVSATEIPYGVDYWILHLVEPLQSWAHSFSEIEPISDSDTPT